MAEREERHYKALYFDLKIKDLEKYYSQSNPKSAYGKIGHYLLQNNFSHEQYSGYHSKYKASDIEIFDFIREMGRQFPWLAHCTNHFEVTDVGSNHDLICLFAESNKDLEIIPME